MPREVFEALISQHVGGLQSPKGRLRRECNTPEPVLEVMASEATTVPAGTFKALKIVHRYKSTGAISYEEWYAPDVRMWVRERDRLEAGPRLRELTSYHLASRTAAVR